jgi:hypothetical protein
MCNREAGQNGIARINKSGQIGLVGIQGEDMALGQVIGPDFYSHLNLTSALHFKDHLEVGFQRLKSGFTFERVRHRGKLIPKLIDIGGHQDRSATFDVGPICFHSGSNHEPVAVPVVSCVWELAPIDPKGEAEKAKVRIVRH